MKPRIFFILIGIFAVMFISQAQKGIHKFGNIPMEEMEMTVYEPDSSAVAVTLLKTGQYLVKDYKFYVHKRIKILKTAGTDYANFVINAPNKGSFKASTFNLENGEIVEYKLKRSEMFEEEVAEDLIVYKLYLPNVKVGSVVEIEYSHFSLPNEWKFQESIPVKHNELLVQKSQYYIFDVIHSGVYNLKWHGGYHWSGHDIPAFKPEPLMNDPSNYIRKVEFQFTEISIPGQLYKKFSTSWEKISENLSEETFFGNLFRNGTSYLNDKAKELEEKDIPVDQKIMEAYAFIKKNIAWNGEHGIYASQDYKKNFRDNHSGSVADINLSLVALLKKSGISAYPVVLSTKDNGVLNRFKPSINKLNYVVCFAIYDDKTILLDATLKDLIPGVLPIKCLNGDGWLVDDDTKKGQWVDLSPQATTLERSFAQIELDDDGTCTAHIVKSLSQYDYLDWKENYDKYNDESKYVRSLESAYEDVFIEDYSVNIDSSNLKVSEKYQIDLTERLEDFGDEIILDPFVFSVGMSNPFNSDERISNVDLEYKSAIIRTIIVKLPESMTVDKGIEPITVITDDEKAQFAFSFNNSTNQISIRYQVAYTSPTILVNDYPVFKVFYSLMIDKLNESLTIRRI